MYFRPSWTSWWARQTNSILLIWLNCIEKRPSSKQNQLYIVINKRKKNTSWVTLVPKSQPAPRGLTAHVSISSGSLHIRSQKGPSCGISQLRSIVRIWWKDNQSFNFIETFSQNKNHPHNHTLLFFKKWVRNAKDRINPRIMCSIFFTKWVSNASSLMISILTTKGNSIRNMSKKVQWAQPAENKNRKN